MLTRRNFLAAFGGSLITARLMAHYRAGAPVSEFSRHLQPVGRALEMKDWYVWCNSPIEGPDGKIHVFFSRWPAAKGMGGWINSSEIAHAVADHTEGKLEDVDTVL